MSDRRSLWQMSACLREMGSAGWYALGAVAALLAHVPAGRWQCRTGGPPTIRRGQNSTRPCLMAA